MHQRTSPADASLFAYMMLNTRNTRTKRRTRSFIEALSLDVYWSVLTSRSSPVAQLVKDPVLSLQQLGVLLWPRFNPWPGELLHARGTAKKINKQTLSTHIEPPSCHPLVLYAVLMPTLSLKIRPCGAITLFFCHPTNASQSAIHIPLLKSRAAGHRALPRSPNNLNN